MTNIDTDDFLNLTGAYALDALDDHERKLFESKLPFSEQARHEVTELSDTAAMLGMAVTSVQPSPELKRNLMELIAVTPQLDPLEDEEAETVVFSEPVKPTKQQKKAELKAKTRWFKKSAFAGFSVAIAASFVVVAAVTGQTSSTNIEQQNQANGLASISQAFDSHRIEKEVPGSGTATVMWSDSVNKSAVFVNGIPHLANNKSYQLWYINSKGEARSAGLLSNASVAQGWQVLDGTMKSGDSVAATVEPSGGSKAPTTKPVFLVKTS